MTGQSLATRTDPDARLALVVAAGCVVALAAFVVAPAFGVLGALGAVATVFLAPVAAGLAGYASFVALWRHAERMTSGSRHLHLLTLLVVAAFFVALTVAWQSGTLAWLGD